MVRRFLISFKNYDWYLIINMLLLMIFGLTILYSLQLNVANPNFTLLNRQLVSVIIGLVLFMITSSINYRIWSDYYKVVFVISFLLLAAVLLFGVNIRGTTGWLVIFGQTFQPVELVKIGLVVFLAKFFTIRGKPLGLFKDIFFSGFISALLIVLVAMQPDLGSAMILFLTWLTVVLLMPLRKRDIAIIFILIAVVAISFWFGFIQDYQKERILTFINPQLDPLGTGYNVRQSIVAIGSGGVIGKGIAFGSQSQLNFLPEQETDFIFAVIAEEMGFIGAGLVLILFISLFIRIYFISRKTIDSFASIFALGVIVYLSIQTFINIGMNMGIAPVTGVPLPLVSYGGSSLISVLIALGIINNICIKNKTSLFTREE